ncbi:MAG: hypothetical protein ACRD3D_01055 [Terriglobia bacterium]
MNAQRLINSALRLVGATASGEGPTGDESKDSLAALNDMLDSWNTQRLAIYTVVRNVFSLVSGKGSYTYGTGGDFDAPRPPRIVRASLVINSNPSQPLELPIPLLTLGQWQSEPVKDVQSSFPLEVYDDQGFPFRTLAYWPIPVQAGNQAALYAWQALPQFADLTTDYEFPPGYARALRFNLAVDLAPEFGVQQVNPVVMKGAADSLAVVKVMNIRTEPMLCDAALLTRGGGIYNWLTDQMIRGRG